MASVNKVILVGNAGRDAEMRQLNSGMAAASVTLATTSRRKDKTTGEVIEDTQWHRVTFYDRLAEIAGEYVKKGRSIYVEGRLKYGKYTDKDGIERSTVEIVATELQLLGNREGGDAGAGEAPAKPAQRAAAPAAAPAAKPTAKAAPAKVSAGFDEPPFEDDIPF